MMLCLFHYFMDGPKNPDMVTLGNGATALLRSLLHAGLVEVHLHRQRPRLLIGLRLFDGDGDHGAQGVRVDFGRVVQELFVSVDAQLGKEEHTQTNELITVARHCPPNLYPLQRPPPPHLCLDVLLRRRDQAGAAQPQHDHDGQEEAGGQNPAREAGAPAGARRERVSVGTGALNCSRLTWTCSPGSRAQPRHPPRAGRRACPSRLLYLPLSLREPSHLQPDGAPW